MVASFEITDERCPGPGLSSPEESHPEALPEPYLSLATHTAPMVKATTLSFPQRQEIRLSVDHLDQPLPSPAAMTA